MADRGSPPSDGVIRAGFPEDEADLNDTKALALRGMRARVFYAGDRKCKGPEVGQSVLKTKDWLYRMTRSQSCNVFKPL